MNDSSRERAINAVDLLNDLVGDFITGTMVLARYHAECRTGSITPQQLAGINKMCVSHLVLGLNKWAEFYDRFHDLIPSELKDHAKRIKKTIEGRKFLDFRNKYVGHIWDKDNDRPLLNSEIVDRLNKIMNDDARAFLRWLNHPDSVEYSKSVAGTSEAIRDSIAAEFGIKPGDILDR